MTGFHVALATNPTVSMMSRPSPVALAALVPPVATLASVLATAVALGFVGCPRAHRFDSASKGSAPALSKRRHRVVARRFVPIRRRRAALEVVVTNPPKPRLGSRGYLRFHYAPNDDIIGEHVEIVVAPFAGGRCVGTPEVEVRRHRSLPQSSSASRFTAGASGFFILSQSGERPER